jgi:hypothetical protein
MKKTEKINNFKSALKQNEKNGFFSQILFIFNNFFVFRY